MLKPGKLSLSARCSVSLSQAGGGRRVREHLGLNRVFRGDGYKCGALPHKWPHKQPVARLGLEQYTIQMGDHKSSVNNQALPNSPLIEICHQT